MPYIIKTQKGYVKRTSNFGAYHGRVVLTDDVTEALRFTRLNDAERRARVLEGRTHPPNSHPSWPFPGRDHAQFGQLTAEVLEHS